MTIELDRYRQRAEKFLEALDREYYRHYAGLKDDFEIEPIYAAFEDLFDRAAVEALRDLASHPAGPTAGRRKKPGAHASAGGDGEARRLRELSRFAVEGFIGRANRAADAEIARREARLELTLDGEVVGFRESTVLQANEPDAGRRTRIEEARLSLVEDELNPLHREAMDRSHRIAGELGWPSYREMFAELKGIDLSALARAARDFLDRSETAFETVIEPAIQAQLGFGLDRLRRSDLPFFFRALSLDAHYPAGRLLASLEGTLSGLDISLARQRNVIVDAEFRPNKSPRAFCATVRVPEEIYLVTTRTGGREDFSMALHEAGHAQHYAHTDPILPFEFRLLGDSSVTETFAFLLDHLVDSPEWLERRLGVAPGAAEAVVLHARGARLLLVRRYAAKLLYEVELHAGLDTGPGAAAAYAGHLSRATRTDWPAATCLADVDQGFYVAQYLRAWAAEAQLRRLMCTRFGEAWFGCPGAGDFLRGLWRAGQSLRVEESLEMAGAGKLTLDAVLGDLASPRV